MVFLDFHAVGTDIVLEAVSFPAAVFQIERKVAFLATAIKIVKNP